ncbi:MAG TPA: hypothetical protein VI542_08705 [Candidatus Tectomicrobia bacterium]
MVTRNIRPLSPSNADWVIIRRFCWRTVVFFAPLLGLCALFEFVMWRTGETWPVSRVIDTQLRLGTTRSLYSRMLFSQRINGYKYAMLKRLRPMIVIQGTSRVMQIRDVMFHPLEKEFYNAGGMIQSPYDVATYTERIRSGDLPKPAVLIFGIDPWWVKEGDTHHGWLDSQSLQDDVWLFAAHIKVARQLVLHRPAFPWQAVLTGVPSPSPGYHYQAIGAAALLHGAGFRIDGSLQLEPAMVLDSLQDPRYNDRLQILQMVTEHRGFYTLPVRVDPMRVTILLTALTALQQLGIEVYVFLPPFASAVQTVFETSPTWQSFWRWYRLDLPVRLRAAGLPCLPLSAPQQDGFDDSYMYDGHHHTEIYAAALVQQILQHASSHGLLRTVDRVPLDRLLARTSPTPLSFEPPPPF